MCYYYTGQYRHSKIDMCASVGIHRNAKGKESVLSSAIWLVGNQVHLSAIKEKLYSALHHAITWLLFMQLFFNCTQMHVSTYTNVQVIFVGLKRRPATVYLQAATLKNGILYIIQ